MANRQYDANLLKKQGRTWFDFSSLINLNAGATSPTPQPVLAVAESWRRQLSADPVGVIWLSILHAIEESRQSLAAWLGAEPVRLLLFSGTTLAVNTVVQTYPWQPNDEVILTDLEYHHYLPLWKRTAERCHLHLKIAALPTHSGATPDEILQIFADAMTPRTRLIFCSHVVSSTGLVLPIKEIVRHAREQNVATFVDGAHGPGLVPVNLKELDCDFYAANCNKWLMAPVGSAFLFVAERARFAIEPLVCTESMVFDKKNPDRQEKVPPTPWIRAFEYQGTQDRSAQTAIATALTLRQTLGEENIREHMAALRRQICAHMAQRGLTVLSPEHPELASAMVTCLIPTFDRIEAWKWFRKHGFEIGFPVWKDGETVMRLSGAWFVEPQEVDRFFALYDEFSGSIPL